MKVVSCDLEEILYVENWEKSKKLIFSSKLPMFLPPLGRIWKTMESGAHSI